LDETYLLGERPERPLTGLVDFLFFLVEAGAFYVMALLIPQAKSFFFVLGLLLLMDVVWLAWVYFNAPKSFGKVRPWLWLNVSMIVVLVVLCSSEVVMADNVYKWGLLTGLALLRSVLDYALGWPFYWPAYTAANVPTTDQAQWN